MICFVTFIDLVAGGWLWLVVGCDTRPKSGDAQRKLMRFQCEYNFSRRNSIYKYLARERRGINILPTNHRWWWWWCWWWCVDGSCLSLDFSQLLLLRRRWLVGAIPMLEIVGWRFRLVSIVLSVNSRDDKHSEGRTNVVPCLALLLVGNKILAITYSVNKLLLHRLRKDLWFRGTR